MLKANQMIIEETRDIAWYKAKAKDIKEGFSQAWEEIGVCPQRRIELIHAYRQRFKREKIKFLLSYKGIVTKGVMP
jgi:hypothetical protein